MATEYSGIAAGPEGIVSAGPIIQQLGIVPPVVLPVLPFGLAVSGGILFRDGVAVPSGGAAPSTMFLGILKGNSLGVSQGVKMRFFGSTLNNANAKTVRVNIGGVLIDLPLTINVVDLWQFDILFLNNGGGFISLHSRSEHGISGAAPASLLFGGGGQAVDLTTDIAISLIQQVGGAGDVIKRGVLIESIA